MSIRIVLLFTGISIATNGGVAQAALQPVDPAHARVAVVDRFSDGAGTLLMRSADKRLPGPNEPIDFDTAPLNTLGFRLYRPGTANPRRVLNLDESKAVALSSVGAVSHCGSMHEGRRRVQ